jgi:DNA uptake protein ComE-like DNA-binding protein
VFKKLSIFFEHNRAERNGTIAILIFVFISLIATWIFTEFHEPKQEDLTELAVYVEENKVKAQLEVQDTVKLRPFQFNPNTLSDSGYAQLGFSQKEIQTLRNYQKAGGSFKVKSDFSKLFFVDSAEYRQLKPFILLPDSLSFKKKDENQWESKETAWSDTSTYVPFKRDSLVELNTADTNALKALRGIGSFYAREIVKYRSELGGYHNIGQLLELWKMEPDKIDAFANRVYIDPEFIQTIKINQLTSQELSNHPYISLHLASKLIYSRESEGKFKDLKDLQKRKLVNEELSSKLAPYLDFE